MRMRAIGSLLLKTSAVLLVCSAVAFAAERKAVPNDIQLELVKLQRDFFGEPSGLKNSITIIFLLIGPLSVVPAFAHLTENADARMRRQIALGGFVVSVVAVLVIAWLGEGILRDYTIPITALALAGGLILSIVSARAILAQYGPPQDEQPPENPNIRMAVTPLVFPTILPPHAIAMILLFLVLASRVDGNPQLLLAIILGILLLNFMGMLVARQILKVLRPGILQFTNLTFQILILALGISFIIASVQIEALIIKLLMQQ